MELFKSRTRVAYTNAVGDKVYPVIVDIKRGIKSTEEIQFMSSDINTGILSVAFIQGNENYNVSGAEVVCSVMRPDVSTLDIPCTIVENNIVEVPLGINGTSQDGIYSFDFKVFKGGNKVVGTPIMNYSVSLSIHNDNTVLEDDRLPVLTMLITQVTELKDEVREAINQANTATEATREATANAIEATTTANETINRVTQDTANAIAEVNATSDTMVENVNNAISSMDTTVNNKISEMTNTVNDKISEVNTAKNDMINDVSNTKANMVTEVTNAKDEMTTTVSNKIDEVENRFNALTSSQQQSSEVIDARDGETSLKARLDRDIEKAKQVYINIEGSNISTDSNVGYAKDVEILGNTIQNASNLADIRSVGDTVEGQELYEIPVLSRGKNLCISRVYQDISDVAYAKVKIRKNCTYTISTSLGIGGGHISLNTEPVHTGNKQLISDFGQNKYTFTSNLSDGEYYLVFWKRGLSSSLNDTVQLEEGTQATPYEPYQEDKLTILSPVQLEKVGDVADRIIEKDGVWGVEKNVVTKYIDSNIFTAYDLVGGEFIRWYKPNVNEFIDCIHSTTVNGYCDKYNVVSDEDSRKLDKTALCLYGGTGDYRIMFIVPKDINHTPKLNTFIQNNPFTIKYPTTQPQFIPLPHSQQVKLRTFANKTNISFGCEIEGTIKAQVPKSLGATVNTHTEQIRSLNNELNRVKKLEESTVSTVTTESDFTIVEATSNGYFEDVKLEGKTLVNLCTNVYDQKHNSVIDNGTSLKYTKHPQYAQCDFKLLQNLKQNTTYTVFLNVTNFVEDMRLQLNFYKYGDWVVCSNTEYIRAKGVHSILLTTTENIADHIRIGKMDSNVESMDEYITLSKDIVILEGDHTQNPPNGYIKGLKSVGQSATTSEGGVDEISVESVKNLLDYTKLVNKVTDGTTGSLATNNNRLSLDVKDRIEVYSPHIYVKCRDVLVAVIGFVEKDGVPIYDSGYLQLNTISNLSLPSEVKYITINAKIGNETPISKEALKNVFIYHQSDKKLLLYYNEETQTWEKPILRQWDSIEKHANGKYYYHQRSGEVVLDGSESIELDKTHTNNLCFRFVDTLNKYKSNCDLLSDKFIRSLNVYDNDIEGLYYTGVLRVNISKSKLPTQNIAGFKQWLQANNVTVVYQLAQEKVYECTNIDLITYSGETNYIVESGAIVPRTTLKVHNNISNVVKVLQEKVSLLENKFIIGLKQVLAGDMYSLAELLYPEDFVEENPENNIMLLPFE